MTTNEPEERALMELFEHSAQEADGPMLTRLKARAVDIPKTKTRYGWLKFFAPTAALGLCAALAVGLARSPETPTELETHASIAPSAMVGAQEQAGDETDELLLASFDGLSIQ